ncbi:MAG TPA: LURP-one-related family protein [Phycisphaerae bacterium]|nr:LURP-one-related family protein [Phycisphaerae bacterium]HRW52003.1 LURP-one-related family protein [Phycisphaerae bacterium]
MRYQLRQKLFSWGDDFTIRDALGRDVFFVDGRAFSLGDKLSFHDMAGNELVFIQQRLLNWGPTYEITAGGRLVAIVKKKLFTFFRCQFTVDVPGPNDLVAEGEFLHHEYAFRRFGRPVAHVSKQWFSFSDIYGVDIAEGENPVLILAAAVVIDQVCHDGDDD